MSILRVQELVKSFGRRRVVNEVCLHVEPGEIVGLLGPNGAGKTTTFRMICGLLKPDRGNVFLRDQEVTDWPMYRRARTGEMGYLPQQSSVFAKLSVQQNLIAMMQLLNMKRSEQKRRCTELLQQFDIEKLRKSRAGNLSGGERRRLEIARCLVSDPGILMLDEPFAGIDPVTVQSIQEIIHDLADSGISILITDHAAREILQITDRTYVVFEGEILCSGPAREVVEHEKVKEVYLGELDFEEKSRDRNPSPPVEKIVIPNLQESPEPPLIEPPVNDSLTPESQTTDLVSMETSEIEPNELESNETDPAHEAPRRPHKTAAPLDITVEAPFRASSLDLD